MPASKSDPSARPSIWLVKSEPSVYAFAQLQKDKKTMWEGVRNFEARNSLRAMKKGDLCLYYHSNEDRAIVGVAKVAREAYPDPTADEGDWSVVDLAPVKALARPITLAELKAHPALRAMKVVTRSRISVTPVTPEELALVLELGRTKL